MNPYPILFEPILKPRVWGGDRLRQLGHTLPDGVAIGESWELADLPASIEAGRSIISNGELAGTTLREALQRYPTEIMGVAPLSDEGGFPLLIKYLDARENLSVQVHPDAAYVRRHPETHLKSEAWVVIDAEPGAVIYRGLRPGVTRESLRQSIHDDTVPDDLIAVPVKPGDCHYLPSGTCHALGAGILVAEVQTPSDTTFRLYDWGRPGRALHVDAALECMSFDQTAPPEQPAQTYQAGATRTTRLVETDYFDLTRIEATSATAYEIVTGGMPMVWMMTAGCGRIEGNPPVALGRGTTVLLPAGLDGCRVALEASASMLEASLPSPTKGLLA